MLLFCSICYQNCLLSSGSGVRIPAGSPRRSKLHIACSDLFYKSERAHSAAPPFQITTTSLGCDLGLGLGAGQKSVPRKCSLFPRRSKLHIACSDFFQKPERAHSAAPPFQITTTSLGCDLGLGLGAGQKSVPRKCSLFPRRSKLHIACSDFFQKPERAHSAAPPFQITTTSLGCDLGLGLGAGQKSVPRKCSLFPCRSKRPIACSDLFYKSERTHFAAPPLQTATAYAGVRFGYGCRFKKLFIKSVCTFLFGSAAQRTDPHIWHSPDICRRGINR